MIPQHKKFMLPILKICKDGGKFRRSELASILADQFKLTEAERNQLKSSGGERLLVNRIGWAAWYLKKAELLNGARGVFSITEDGKNILRQNLENIDKSVLMKIPAFKKFTDKRQVGTEGGPSIIDGGDSGQSPEEMIISGYKNIKENVKQELLEKINNNSPDFFERLVLELVRKMGYGINHEVLGHTGDGGIDGVIREDKLGFNEIYFQAKRWKGTVPIHQIRDFAGALMSKKSKRGIFITSSDFSDDAHKFVKDIETKIVLINGIELTEHMYNYNLGVSIKDTYTLKRIDEDYFADN